MYINLLFYMVYKEAVILKDIAQTKPAAEWNVNALKFWNWMSYGVEQGFTKRMKILIFHCHCI